MLVNHFLEKSAVLYPEKVALITRKGRYSYREINEMANRIAHALIAGGLQKGDRAAVLMKNSMEAVASLFGILKAGGIFIMVNPTTKAEKLSFILNNCSASVLLSNIQKLETITYVRENVCSLRAVFLGGEEIHAARSIRGLLSLDDVLTSADCAGIPSRTIDLDLATIIYTSGSTGRPKGAMMTHLSMVSAANSITAYLENVAEDIILNVLPISFDYGLYQVLMGFKVGATVILERSFLYPYKIIETILTEKVTGFPIVPTIAAILLQMDDLRKNDFESLRYITSTGALLPISHISMLRTAFPKTKIYSMYGLTECKRVSYLPPEQLGVRPGSVGKGMPNEEVYIVDVDGNKVGPGIIGELIVRGSNVMSGYWGLPDETARRLKPSPYPGEMLLYTGDLFRMDEEGYLYFVSRTDDIMKCRGEKVSPREIENVICQMPGVVEAAVIGVPDQVLGEAVKAFVVPAPGVSLSQNEVLQFCSMNLEDFMVPKYIEFRDHLPVTGNGKINKEDLK